jgi:hypothetical protein
MWSVFLITRMAIEELLAADYQMVSNSTFSGQTHLNLRTSLASRFAMMRLVKAHPVDLLYRPLQK